MTVLNVVGDTLHNVVDGMVIAASYLSGNPALGLATTVAVVLHEIPHELGDIGILVHGGVAPRSAVWVNCATGVGALLGATITLLVGAHVAGLTDALLPIAAGNFLYVAASDLIPELQGETTPRIAARQVAVVLAGVLIVAAPALVE